MMNPKKSDFYILKYIFVVFWIFLIVLSIFNQKVYWPFSHYPMYNKSYRFDYLNVYRLMLETENGAKDYWKAYFNYSMRHFDVDCRRIMMITDSKERSRQFFDLLRRARIEIRITENIPDLKKLHIIQTKIKKENNTFITKDQIIYSAETKELL